MGFGGSTGFASFERALRALADLTEDFRLAEETLLVPLLPLSSSSCSPDGALFICMDLRLAEASVALLTFPWGDARTDPLLW